MSDDALFTDEPPPSQSDALFTDEPPPESFLTKTANSIIPDLGSTAVGLGNTVKQGLYDIPKAILKAPQTVARTGMELSEGVPLGETTLSQERPEWSKNPIETAKAMARPIAHPIDYFSEHPVQQTLNILGLKEGAGALMGKEPLALPASEAPAALPRAEMPPPSEAIPPRATEELPPASAKPQTPPQAATIPYLDEATKAANEVKNYISSNYEKFAKQPGAAQNIADYAQEKSQMMAVKAAGGSPLFATQGIRAGKTPIQINNELRAVGQYMLDKGIVKPELGNKVMLETQEALQKASGAKLGAIRKMADEMRVPTETPVDVLQAVQAKLGDQYAPGMPGAQEYQTALKIIEKADPTFEGAADAATDLNKLANKANRNFQPHTPYTDVANEISQINNERIKSLVGPKAAAEYEQALREFGVNKKIQSMLGRKVGQNLHRTGPGSLTRAAYQKFMDEVGYKGGAKVMNRMAGEIKNNPSIARNLPSLFKTFINEVEDIMPHEQGMAGGGLVEPDIDKEIHHHLLKEHDPEYAKFFRDGPGDRERER